MPGESFKVPSPYKAPFLMAIIGGLLIGSSALVDLLPLKDLFIYRITLVSLGAFVFGSGLYFMSYNVGKRTILEHPRKLLVKLRRVGGKTEKAEKAYMDAWRTRPWEVRKFYSLVNESVELSASGIIKEAKRLMKKKGYDVSKVERILHSAYEEYKKGTDKGIENGGKLIKKAIKTARELKISEKKAISSTKKAERILKEIKAKEYTNKKKEVDEAEDLLKMSRDLLKKEDFKTALILAQEAQKKAAEMKDIEERSKRYVRKTEMIMEKLENEEMISPADPDYLKATEIYNASKIMIDKKMFDIGLVLIKEAKSEAEKLLPTDELTPWGYVCPICFDYICPDEHCGLSISPSPLKEDTCRYVCECGAHYHLCCIDHIKDFKCVYCGKPLKTHMKAPS